MAIGTQCPAYALRYVDPQPDASHEFPNGLPPTRVRIPRQSQHGAGSGATRGAVIDGADVDAPVRAAGGHARPLRIAQAPVLAGGMTRESSTRDLVWQSWFSAIRIAAASCRAGMVGGRPVA